MSDYPSIWAPVVIGDATLYTGDVLEVLAGLPEESVHCIVTSPPYWGLRDYGTGQWEGGNAECDHKQEHISDTKYRYDSGGSKGFSSWTTRDVTVHGPACRKCGARRIDQQIGLEETPEQYVAKMVEVFRAVHRVLRKDGTCWVNLGASYAGSGKAGNNPEYWGKHKEFGHLTGANPERFGPAMFTPPPGYKQKDMIPIPWMVAMALQADGWYLRSDIIWAKPNPMPESVTDRPTKAHEYLFLFAKGQWKSTVIQFSNLPGERFHFLKYFGLRPSESAFSLAPSSGDHSSLIELCIRLASSILNSTQLQKDFSLPPFYSEVWQKGADGSDSYFVCGLPVMHRPALWASRFFTAQATAKEFLCELKRLGVTLADGNQFLIGGLPIELLNAPSFHGDREGTITVHHAGEICKIDFVHNQIVVQKPINCKYFYDAEAIREAGESGPSDLRKMEEGLDRIGGKHKVLIDPLSAASSTTHIGQVRSVGTPGKRNRRTVWNIATEPYPEAHFATFPRKLVQPCILAGCPEHACPKCGAPWVRDVERGELVSTDGTRDDYRPPKASADPKIKGRSDGWAPNHMRPSVVTGEHPTCTCGLPAIGGTVMDIFGGSGTTAEVALEYGRRAILIELKPEYVELQKRRLAPVAGRPMLDFVGGTP